MVFLNKQVRFVKGVPKETEFGVAVIKEMIKDDELLKSYLPDWSEKHRPDKGYLCNIINTVHPDSIKKWVIATKALKSEEKEKARDDFLLIDKETLAALETFSSLYQADDDKRNRLAGLLCEKRKKVKADRKDRFILKVAELKNFADFVEE